MKVYVVLSALDYEGWTTPWMVTDNREKVIALIREASQPGPTEEYEVYEYVLNEGEQNDQGEQITGRASRRPLWVKQEASRE